MGEFIQAFTRTMLRHMRLQSAQKLFALQGVPQPARLDAEYCEPENTIRPNFEHRTFLLPMPILG
jgi:hypothetical protein